MASWKGMAAAAAAVALAALLVGLDRDVDVRLQLTHVLLRAVFGTSRLLGVAPPFEAMNGLAPTVAAGAGADGVTSVDLVVPHAPESVFPGVTALEDVGVRVYHPTAFAGRKLPILVYFHGGGFTFSRAAHRNIEEFIRRFAVDGPMLVVSVDYRLAPAVTFPGPVDDCVAAVLWAHAGAHPILQQHADTSKIAVIGDSAGGNLVAVVTQALLKHHPHVKVAYQILVYPVNPPLAGQTTESREQFANGWLLFKDAKDSFSAAYLPKNQPALLDSYIVHPRLGDAFGALPPGQVIVAEWDMLRDEGIEYYNALKAAGVDVTLRVYPKSIHGFFGFQFLPEAQQAYKDVMAELRSKFLGAR